ncbi:MAG: ring-cleaving dioxygenase [Anaerolineaceae bacterium]|nr:ring-cleaving dioxygenase [Anaerolineaceae bacterium]
MDRQIPGIHHVTAIASDPQRNVTFYTDVLGLRLVKLTVNFDDPGTYHLYYGDEQGQPGTILTFFPWPGARRGRRGAGQVAATSFLVPEGTLDYWEEHLQRAGASFGQRQRRFGQDVLPVLDPDALQLELVAHPAAAGIDPWRDGPVAPENAIRGFHGATMWELDPEPTVDLLTRTMGFELEAEEGPRFRFRAASPGPGSVIDVVHLANGEAGQGGAGTVHHIAYRTHDDAQQLAWRQELMGQGLHVTPVMDRQYFRSIYYREPGGVLFEIATDPPGFTRDESLAELGTHLKLPPWLEPRRAGIEAALPELRLSRIALHEPA